jgi:hypothetical protein
MSPDSDKTASDKLGAIQTITIAEVDPIRDTVNQPL